jgi:hypothetical protein
VCRRSIGTITDQQQSRRHTLTNAIEDGDHRVDAFHRPEVRDVDDDPRVGITACKSSTQLGSLDAPVDGTVEEVRDHDDRTGHAELGDR